MQGLAGPGSVARAVSLRVAGGGGTERSRSQADTCVMCVSPVLYIMWPSVLVHQVHPVLVNPGSVVFLRSADARLGRAGVGSPGRFPAGGWRRRYGEEQIASWHVCDAHALRFLHRVALLVNHQRTFAFVIFGITHKIGPMGEEPSKKMATFCR
jgi:hypothetical protein